jgi:predicted MFS family arabinose efflux permease
LLAALVRLGAPVALVVVWGLGFGAVPVAAQSWMAQAMPANVEGGLALFVSALQGSLAAGSAVGGIVYDTVGPGGALIVATAVAACGALTLLSRAGAAISAAPVPAAETGRAVGKTTTRSAPPAQARPESSATPSDLPRWRRSADARSVYGATQRGVEEA